MTEAQITRKAIIVVNEVGENTYGDLTFTDKGGDSYKVSSKRKLYFEKILIPGTAVQLNYAMSSFGKEYIYSAVQIKDKLPTEGHRVEAAKKMGAEVIPEPSQKGLSKDAQIERAVWIKELGECIRSGDIDKTTPQGKSLRDAYYTEMLRVLGITIKKQIKGG